MITRADPRRRFEIHSFTYVTPSAHREADPLDAFHAEGVRDHEIAHLEHRFSRALRSLLDAQAHSATDHQLGELLRRRLLAM